MNWERLYILVAPLLHLLHVLRVLSGVEVSPALQSATAGADINLRENAQVHRASVPFLVVLCSPATACYTGRLANRLVGITNNSSGQACTTGSSGDLVPHEEVSASVSPDGRAFRVTRPERVGFSETFLRAPCADENRFERRIRWQNR